MQYSSNKGINKLVRQKIRQGWFWKKRRKFGKLFELLSGEYKRASFAR